MNRRDMIITLICNKFRTLLSQDLVVRIYCYFKQALSDPLKKFTVYAPLPVSKVGLFVYSLLQQSFRLSTYTTHVQPI